MESEPTQTTVDEEPVARVVRLGKCGSVNLKDVERIHTWVSGSGDKMGIRINYRPEDATLSTMTLPDWESREIAHQLILTAANKQEPDWVPDDEWKRWMQGKHTLRTLAVRLSSHDKELLLPLEEIRDGG